MNTIEIFSTNISSKLAAKAIVESLSEQNQDWIVSVDLDDCDKILRVEGGDICVKTITELVQNHGFKCEELTH